MHNNRCLYCNIIIPEGRIFCPICEGEQIKLGMILQSHQATNEEVDKAYDFMEESNDA